MPVTSESFLDFAKICCAESSEIGYRNAVSRSYYSMYHKVLSILDNDIPNYANGGVHSSLLTYLSSSNSESYDTRELKKLSYMLKAARDMRGKADYQLDLNIIQRETAEDSIYQAERTLSLCDSLKNAA